MTKEVYVFHQPGYIPGVAAISPCSAGSIVTIDTDTMKIVDTAYFYAAGQEGIKIIAREQLKSAENKQYEDSEEQIQPDEMHVTMQTESTKEENASSERQEE